jgi:hypothetical protein
MEKNEIKKYLYKKKELMAIFNYYLSGNLYYSIQLEDGVYQFPISTVETDYIEPLEEGKDEREIIKLSSDLGITPFEKEIKASLLNRWIDKAIDNGVFIKI